LRGQDDVVSLNLHERAHGPHGLIAGTTGSGKCLLLCLSSSWQYQRFDVGTHSQ
ncbi:DNA segregation ATPase FtsK/SpoIIIE, S-DNA-T family, partial [Streptococcus gallolyticus]